MSNTQTMKEPIKFIDSQSVLARPEFFERIEVDLGQVLQSWQLSLFSYEWLERDGSVKAIGELNERDQEKRAMVEAALASGDALEIPVLGIGLQDNVEIGSGKAIICTLAAHGVESIPAHVPKSCMPFEF